MGRIRAQFSTENGRESARLPRNSKPRYRTLPPALCKAACRRNVQQVDGAIETFIEKLGERFDIREIAFDRWGRSPNKPKPRRLGFHRGSLQGRLQGISPPSKELMNLALEGRLAHCGHPVPSWMVDNIHVHTDPAGNIKPDKQKSTKKIDGVVATITVPDRAIRCGRGTTSGSVYDERGLLLL
ncbi:phage terminase family protein [Dermabacteraceae bacterium TAE3-ERU27]|nr:phage terminase family protein [Dermabacteraceae bacterium TAE3-ERU27]